MDNFKVLAIECSAEMEQLVTILNNNGYEVNVKPVYETKEDLQAQQRYISRHVRPRVKYYQVEIMGIVEKPVYVED